MGRLIAVITFFIIAFLKVPLTSIVPAELVTLLSTPAPAPTATPVPTPVPTPTLNPIEQKEAEVNQEIQGFLHAEGEYTDKKMNTEALSFGDGSVVGPTKLGIISYGLCIQGCLIDYVEKNDLYNSSGWF